MKNSAINIEKINDKERQGFVNASQFLSRQHKSQI